MYDIRFNSAVYYLGMYVFSSLYFQDYIFQSVKPAQSPLMWERREQSFFGSIFHNHPVITNQNLRNEYKW